MECIYLNIALPIENGKICCEFGCCRQFRFYEIDSRNRKILDRVTIDYLPQSPEKIPGWLRDRGIHVVIANEIDAESIRKLESLQLKVISGITEKQPDLVINCYLNNTLTSDSEKSFLST